jgi:hypothetical protein
MEDHHVEEEQQQSQRTAGYRLLTTLGVDPREWTRVDRYGAILGIAMVLAIVIIAVCGILDLLGEEAS